MAFGIVPRLQRIILSSRNWTDTQKYYLTHPAGPFTIFFWCPFVKWCIVAANISDLSIPAQNISKNQQTAVALTGIVWARYSTQVTPFNMNLLLVNLFMGITGIYQLFRVITHKPSS